jgi:hypothetical protein
VIQIDSNISIIKYTTYVLLCAEFIFGPVQNEDGFWRIRMNHKLNDLIKNADIVRFVKSKRMAWLGHVMWMEGERLPKRVLEWKPMGRKNRGKTKEKMD